MNVRLCPLIQPNMDKFNPLMLTAAKNQLGNFDEIFQAKADLAKFLEKCSSEHYQQHSFKYFVKLFSIQKLLSKVSSTQTTISGGTFKC